MTFVVLLALVWLVANATLVLMLRRNVRVRERELGRAPRTAEPRAPVPSTTLGEALGRP